MAEETKQTQIEQEESKEKKMEKKEEKTEDKNEKKAEEKKEQKTQDKAKESKKAEKKTDKTAEKSKKTQALAYGKDLHVSTKQCIYISKAIKGKRIDDAIEYLNQVILMKKAVPFKGEIPHRKGRIMSGRYPIKASKLVINILKGLKGNAVVNGLDLDKTRISESCASSARRPARSGGRKAKRTHLMIIAKEVKEVNKIKENKSKNQESKKKAEQKK